MANPASAPKKRRKSVNFKHLTVMVTALALLVIAEGASSWSASQPMVTKNEVNVPGNIQILCEKDVLSVSLKMLTLKRY